MTIEPAARPRIKISAGDMLFNLAVLVAIVASGLWVAVCVSYALSKADVPTLLTLAPDRLGFGAVGTASVPVILWILLANWHRNRTLAATTGMFRRQVRILNQTIVSQAKPVDLALDGNLGLFEAAQTALASLKAAQDDLKREAQGLRDTLVTARTLPPVPVQLEEPGREDSRVEETLARLESMLQQFETSGDRLLTNALSAGEAVRETADRLEMAGRTSEASIGGLVESLAGLSRQAAAVPPVVFPDVAELAAVADRLMEYQRELVRAANTAAEPSPAGRALPLTAQDLDGLTGVSQLARHKQEIDALVEATTLRLDQIAGRFDQQVASVGEAERQIADGLEKIGTALARTRAEQEDATRDLESLGERTGGLSARLEGLRAAAVNGSADLMSEADRLQKRAETLSIELRGHSGVISDAVGRASEIGTILRATSTLMSEVTDRAGEASRRILGEFDTTSREIESQGARLAVRASEATGVLDQARLQMETAVANVESTLTGLDRKAGEINFAVSSSLSRLGELTHGLERARSEVVGSSADVGARLEATMTMLQAGITEIRGTAADIGLASEQAGAVTDRLTQAGDALRDRLDDIVRSANEAGDRLAGSTGEVSATAEKARGELNLVGDRIRQEGEVVAAMLTRVASVESALRGVGSMIDEVTARAAETAEQARTSLSSIGHEISTQSAVAAEGSGMTGEALLRTRNQMQGVSEQVDEAFGSLNRKASEINFTVSTAVNRLGELMRGLETAKHTADNTAGALAERLLHATGVIKGEFQAVDEVSAKALERLDRASTALSAGAVDMQAGIHESESRLSALSAQVQAQNAEIDRSVDQAVQSFERAGRSLLEGQQTLAASTEGTTAQFVRLMQDFADGKTAFANSAASAAERLTEVSTQVETRFTAITGIADGARQALTGFSDNLDELRSRGEAISRSLAGTSDTLRADIERLAALAEQSAGDVRASTSGFATNSSEMAEAAARARTEIQRIVNNLREETHAIAGTQEAARGLAEQAASMLKDKVREMAEAARTVAVEAQALRQADTKAKRTLFVSAAKTVLDNLQSLSVDLSKVLDKDLPERTWKNATRADMPGFTKRLATLRDQVPVNDVRTRFMADTQFRSHVLAYMSQFEDLLDQISADDQGDILNSTLMSSDVGKIYYFLMAAVGRDRNGGEQQAVV